MKQFLLCQSRVDDILDTADCDGSLCDIGGENDFACIRGSHAECFVLLDRCKASIKRAYENL